MYKIEALKLSQEYIESATNWLTENFENPSQNLEPIYDHDDLARKRPIKIRNLFECDDAFWNKWIMDCGLLKILNCHYNNPVIFRSAEFKKNRQNYGEIPLHQDCVL